MNWCRNCNRQPSWSRRCRPRKWFYQERRSERRCGQAIQRPFGQRGQLPGRGLSRSASPLVVRRCWIINCTCPNRGARQRRLARIDELRCISRKCRLPNQTRDRGELDSSHGGFGHGVSGLDHSRRGVRAQSAISSTNSKHGSDRISSRSRSTPLCGPRIQRRAFRSTAVVVVPVLAPPWESVSSVAHVTSQLADREWHRLCVGQGAKGPLVFEFAAIRVWATRQEKSNT